MTDHIKPPQKTSKFHIPKKIWVPLFLLVAGSFQLYQARVYIRFEEMTKELESMAQLRKNINRLYNHQSDYSGISNASLIDTHAFSKDWKTSLPNSVYNRYGGAVVVEPFGANNKSYRLTYAQVSPENCENFTFMLSDTFAQVLVNDKPVDAQFLKDNFREGLEKNKLLCQGENNTLTFISKPKP